MLGVVPDEGPVLVEVPHEVVVIIELAQGHHGVSAGQQGAGRTVALGNKFIILVLYFQRKFQLSSKNIVCCSLWYSTTARMYPLRRNVGTFQTI